MKSQLTKFAGNYFSKNVFPYWCVVLADTAIVFVSTAFVHWAFHRTGATYEHRFTLLYTMLLYSVLSWIGARVFRTYSGVVRYSGFVDLLKVVYANALTCLLAVAGFYIFKHFGGVSMTEMKPLQIFATFVLAAMLMLVMRIIVKTLYDVAKTNTQAMRVLIYGALTGGAGGRSTSGRRIRLGSSFAALSRTRSASRGCRCWACRCTRWTRTSPRL